MSDVTRAILADQAVEELTSLGYVVASHALGIELAVLRKDRNRMSCALDEIREIAEDRADGAPDASPGEKAWMRVIVAAERGMNR